MSIIRAAYRWPYAAPYHMLNPEIEEVLAKNLVHLCKEEGHRAKMPPSMIREAMLFHNDSKRKARSEYFAPILHAIDQGHDTVYTITMFLGAHKGTVSRVLHELVQQKKLICFRNGDVRSAIHYEKVDEEAWDEWKAKVGESWKHLGKEIQKKTEEQKRIIEERVRNGGPTGPIKKSHKKKAEKTVKNALASMKELHGK